MNDKPAGFRTGGELTVVPKTVLRKGTGLTIVVNYRDHPEPYRLYGLAGWQRTPTGALAVGAPQIAPWWFPSNDHPRDKATFDVSVAVPAGVEALSNGVLLGVRRDAHGWARWHWRSARPQAPYLAFLAIGQYEVRTATTPDGRPLITAYGDDLGPAGPAARASVERTPEIVEVLAGWFGPYPFEAQGGVVDTGLGWAVETQTRPVYDDGFFWYGANTYVVAHENAHQWFGDSVSVRDWRDVWLNEGFATYTEFLWSEHLGEGTAAEVARYYYDHYAADDEFWQVLPGDPGPDDQFHDAVYERGAMTLQAVRAAVGDDAFFAILRAWAARHKDGTATTAQFAALAERISGVQLDDLFTTWLYTRGKPPAGAQPTARATTAKRASYDRIARTVDLLAAAR